MDIKNIKTLLFENIGIKQTIFKNTFWLAIAEGISRLSGVVLIIYIARILGATEFGKLTFALAFVSIFVVLSDFGLSGIVTREFSRDKENEKEYPAILSLKILLSVGVLILTLIGSYFITPNPIIQRVIWILAIFVLISNFFIIIYAFSQARQRMEYEAGAKIIQAIITVSMVFFILLKFPSIENISYGYLFANLMTLALILLFFHFHICPLNLSWNKAIWQKFLGLSWPLAFTSIFYIIYTLTDSVMMGYWGQITEVGWYNAANKIADAVIIPVGLIATSFYPILSKLFKESKKKLQEFWNYQMELMIILAVPTVAGGLVLAPKIIDFFYDPSFSPSTLAFQILVITAGFIFFCNPLAQILIVSNQQKKNFYLCFTGAIINIALNFFLIPRYSLYGAASATVITYIILFFLTIEFSRRFTPISPFNLRLFKILIIAVLSSLIMFIVISQKLVYNLNIIIVVIIGILIYFATLFFSYKFLSKFNLLSKIL